MNASADSGGSGQPSRRLNDAQLKELMRLIKGANSVELKLTVPASHHRATIQGLPVDPVEAQPRQIYFFDTPDLRLFRAGLVVRARRIAGGKGDTVIKLRPVEPDQIPTDLRNDPSFNIEVDAMPGGYVCSASFKGRSTGQDIRAAVSGKKRLSKIFSKPQRAFYRLHAPMGLDLDSLQPLGPTFILKSRFDIQMGMDSGTPRSMVAEMWLYPDGALLLELSTKCLPNEALSVAAEVRAYLVDKDVPTNATQETKTRTALEFYSKALAAESAAQKGTQRRTARRASSTAARTKSTPAATKATAAKPTVTKAAAPKPAAPKAAAPKPTASKPVAARSSSTTGTRSTRSTATKPAARPQTRRPTARRAPPKQA